jgi:hypothetical protein
MSRFFLCRWMSQVCNTVKNPRIVRQIRSSHCPRVELHLLSTFFAFGLTNCKKTNPSPPSIAADTIAMVGSQPISQAELDYALSLSPGKSAADVLEEIANEESLAQLAIAEGLASEPSAKSAVRRLLASRIREKYSTPQQPTDEEITKATKEWQDAAPPAQVERRLAILRILFDTAGSQEKAVTQLTEAATSFRSSDSLGFGSLSVSASDHTDTRYQGGDAGWVKEGDAHPLLPALVNQALSDLKIAYSPSKVLVADGAAWVVMFWDTRKARVTSITRSEIEANLRYQKEQAAAVELIDTSKERFPLNVIRPQDKAVTNATPLPNTSQQLPTGP